MQKYITHIFLIRKEIIIPKNYIFNNISLFEKGKLPYRYFLYSSTKTYYNEAEQAKIESQIYQKYGIELNTFQEKCKEGEKDSHHCYLIREDNLDDFIIYVQKTNYLLNSFVKYSLFETNDFLIGKKTTLIEHASFFGSIQIFKYLQNNEVKLTQSLWLYAIHSQNADLIHMMEESNVKPFYSSFIEDLKETIK